MAPRPAHTAAPRVKEHNPPSLAASDGLRTYLLPQASRGEGNEGPVGRSATRRVAEPPHSAASRPRSQ